MSRGTWDDDFRDKYGFNDGASYEDRDFDARALIVAEVNKLPSFIKAGVVAFEFDRSGFHNPCMIVLRPVNATEGDVLSGKVREPAEPEDTSEFSNEIDEIVCAAYDAAEQPSLRMRELRKLPAKKKKAKRRKAR